MTTNALPGVAPDPGTGSRCSRILWSCLPAQWPAYYPPVSSVEWGQSGWRVGLPPSWGPPVPRAVGGKERGLVGTFLRLSRGPISPGPGFPTEAPAESPARLQAASPGGREAAGAEAGAGRHLPSPLGQACDASGLRKSVNPSSLSALFRSTRRAGWGKGLLQGAEVLQISQETVGLTVSLKVVPNPLCSRTVIPRRFRIVTKDGGASRGEG